jgi:PAS domain S-box-containing protein
MSHRDLTDTLAETLSLFEEGGEPLTTTDVAEQVGLGRRSTYERLDRLVDCGRLETKKVGANARVWWRPRTAHSPVNTGSVTDWEDSTEPLVSVVDRADIGVFVLDDTFSVAWVNETAERYFGLDRAQVVGRAKPTLIEEEIAQTVEDPKHFAETVLETYRTNHDSERFECHVTAGDNRDERWLEHRSKPIDAGSFAGGRVELYYDVTARKRAEQARWTEHTQFETVIDAVDEYAIFMLDSDGCVRTWNQGAERIKGYAAEDILGEHVSMFYTDEDREDGVPQENLAAAAEHGSIQEEGWRLRADGSRFWATVTITAIRGDEGEITGYVKVTRDMTERRKSKREIERERNFLEQVQEASPVGIGIFDTDGEVLRANQRFMELLGRENEDPSAYSLGDQPVLDADGNEIPYPERPAPKALSTGEPVIGQQIRIDGPDGPRRWLSVNANAFDGDPSGVVATTTDITPLKEQAHRLEQQRSGLQSELDEMFERIDDGFISLDENLRYSYVNDQASEILGASRSELIGEYIWDVFDPGQKAHRAFEEARETQESISFVEYYEPLGTWFENHVYPSENGLSVYFQDITERMERERELERYEQLVETVWDGVYALDENDRFVLVNEAFCDIVGYDRDELLGQHPTLINSEGVNEAANELEAEVLTGNRKVGVLETELRTADGDSVPVETRLGPFEYENGRVGRCGVTRDITDRKEREQVLEEYEQIVETLGDGIYVLDEAGRFRLVNSAFVSMTQFDRTELLDSHARTVFGEKFHDIDEQGRELVVAGERTVATVEEDIYTAGDDTITVESRFSPFDVAGGRGRVGVVRDITDRKEREQKLDRQRENLVALNNLNQVVHDITEAVIEQSTREEIEATVCERLADSESYLFAWVGEVDTVSETVTLRTEAGVEGYLDDIVISVDPEDERSGGATGRAFRTGEMQTTQELAADSRYAPWRNRVDAYGFRSSAAIPIVHEDSMYGTLNVYAERPNAFEGEEGEVIEQLGEIIGLAIAATERKQALLSDELVELQFHIPDVFEMVDIDESLDGTVTLDHFVPIGNDKFLGFGTVTPDSVDGLHALVDTVPHWTQVTIRDETTPWSFELRVSEPPVLSLVAGLGGAIKQASIDEGDYEMTVHVPPSVDVQRIIQTVEDAYPSVQLRKRRQITQDIRPADRLQHDVLNRLTDRQRTVLDTAFHAGFFDWPRNASGEDVAASLDIAAPTFHQHLRKAQRKVVGSLVSD